MADYGEQQGYDPRASVTSAGIQRPPDPPEPVGTILDRTMSLVADINAMAADAEDRIVGSRHHDLASVPIENKVPSSLLERAREIERGCERIHGRMKIVLGSL